MTEELFQSVVKPYCKLFKVISKFLEFHLILGKCFVCSFVGLSNRYFGAKVDDGRSHLEDLRMLFNNIVDLLSLRRVPSKYSREKRLLLALLKEVLFEQSFYRH